MPQIILEVSDSVERDIRAKAAAVGLLPNEYLIHLANSANAATESAPPQMSEIEWQARVREFDKLIASIPSLHQSKVVDDSRESIY